MRLATSSRRTSTRRFQRMVAPSETKPSRDENVTAKQSNRRLLLISVQTWRFQPRSRRLICSLGRFRCRAHLHRGYTCMAPAYAEVRSVVPLPFLMVLFRFEEE